MSCSGRSHHAPAGGGSGNVAGAGASAGEGSGGDAGAGASGGDGAGIASAGGSGPNAFPCGRSIPIFDQLTGLEECTGGYVRRVAEASCPSALPREAAVSGYNEAIDECEFDADCADSESPYAHCGLRQGGFAHVCVDGCAGDADCSSDEVCRCGDPIGRCVPAICSTGADCEAGFDCAEYQAQPGCFSAAFACQTPRDSCVSDADCSGVSPNPAFCRAENGVRICTITQCTTP